jgi:hypothetical protein
MEQNQIKFGIELPKELHRQVKIAVATRGLKMKDASEQAFTAWLEAAEGGKPAYKSGAAVEPPAASPFGELTPEEEQYVQWVLALARQKKPTPSAEIALQAVRVAGTEAVGEKHVSGRRKQKAG